MTQTFSQKAALRKYRQSPKGKAKIQEYKDTHKEQMRAYSRKYHKIHRVKNLARTRFRKYGIDAAAVKALFDSQKQRCAICASKTPKGRGDWHVDHDHVSGIVRGLLCNRCNRMIGLADDKPSVLRRAAIYLRRHNGKSYI